MTLASSLPVSGTNHPWVDW
jgi:hypothetical protein